MIVGRSRSRRGITLVELMAALASLTIVLGLAVALMTMLLKLSGSGRDHMANEAALARAARLFRQDVRGAREVGPIDAKSRSLRLVATDDSAVEYSIDRSGLVRAEFFGDQAMAGERLRLPPSANPRFESSREDGRTIVTLVLDRVAKSSGGTAVRTLRVDAVAGATLRFEPQGGRDR